MKKLFYMALSLVLLNSCSKDEEDKVALSPYPSISFVSLSQDTVVNFKNSLALVISYKDNNGDIGYEDPDVNALWVKDSRLDSADWYYVQPVAPVGKNIVVQGKLEIVLNSMFILGNGQSEIVSLSVMLKDRAGHCSNIIYTPNITIKRD